MHTTPPTIDADDAPLPEGDVVAAPLPSGAPLVLRFASPYEPWLQVRDRRVMADVDAEHRAALLWLHRRLIPLSRTLDVGFALHAMLSPHGIVVTDLVSVDDDAAVDHAQLSSMLEGANVKTLDFVALGVGTSKTDLQARVRHLFAAGTPIEVRVEDRRRVIARRRWRVGR